MKTALYCMTATPAALAWPAAGAESDLVEQGRYISTIGGCNDCHTSGYLMSEGQVPDPAPPE